MKIGAVTYLNTKPLVYRMDEYAPTDEVIFDYPSRLADRLAHEDLDVALIPSIEFFHGANYRIASDACIACRGPVWSVKLFARKPLKDVRMLALDEGSRTSVALAKILLAKRYGVYPTTSPLPLEANLDQTDADAVLLIGDRAIHSPLGRFAEVWDLGDEWRKQTGLSFVFAVWGARAGIPLEGLTQALNRSRDDGVKHLSQIAAMEGPKLGLTAPECLSYLRDNLYFYLGPEEIAGLELYYRWASEMNLAPKGLDIERLCDFAVVG